MQNYMIRHYMELFYLFINRHVQFDDLCKLFDISSKTLFSDYNILEEMCHYYGAKLQMENKTGTIVCLITDQNLFDWYFSECSAFYSQNLRNPRSMVIRLPKIGALIIDSNDYVKIDDICETLNYSRSNLRNDLKYIRSYFDSFHITLKNVPFYGIGIEGSEIDKRYALNNLNLRMNETVLIDQENEEDKHNYYLFDQRIKSILRELYLSNHLAFAIGEIRRIKHYIYLQMKRITENHYVTELPNCTVEELKHTIEYRVAESFYQKASISLGPYREYEIASLAILFITMQDYTVRFKLGTIDPDYLQQAEKLYHALTDYMRGTWNLDFQLAPKSNQTALFLALLGLTIKHKFNMVSNRFRRMHSYNGTYFYQPVIATITYNMIRIAEEMLDTTIEKSQFYEISRAIYYYVSTVEIHMRTPRIAITLGQDSVYGEIYHDYLKKYLNPVRYETIEVVPYSILVDKIITRKKEDMEYDLVITDTISMTRFHHVPWFLFDEREGILHIDQLARLLKSKAVVTDINLTSIDCIESEAKDAETILNEMMQQASRYQHFTEQEITVIKKNTKEMMSQRDTVITVIPSSHYKENRLILGRLKTPCIFTTNLVDSYALLLMNADICQTKCLNALLRILVFRHTAFTTLFTEPTENTINELIGCYLLR